MCRRLTNNMQELEKNAADKKLFDPLKAKAQLEVYKEIYRLEEMENLPEDQKKAMRQEDGALKILKTASENDMDKINQFFEKSQEDDKSEIERQMEKLQLEIESLEEVHSTHQGYKFFRASMTRDIFEDALVELREKQFEKKFRADKEKMTGDVTVPKLM